MLDKNERRPALATGSYWSALINPALLSFNDFQNFIFYQRNLAAMHHFQQQQQELFRHHFGNCFVDKKRPAAARSEAESPKPKRVKTSEPSHSGKWKQPPRPVAASSSASSAVADSPADLRAETTTPNSNRSGLITFRPHSDILTSCLDTSGQGFKTQLHRKKSESGELKKVDSGSTAMMPASSNNDLSNLLTDPEVLEEGEGPISGLFPEILSLIFEYLDLQSKGRAAQVTENFLES
jgi:hypothetical protein